jgi:leader peptidase (prepilin peptidase)/N-methyltransferase
MGMEFATLFPYAATLPAGFILAGLIWSLALGFAAGNYACSLVHRLPRGLGILEKKPYCGSCNAMLATKDLFPVASALLLNHKCRYCGAAIPKSHFYTELLIGALFCLCFAVWGFSEHYYIVALLGSMTTVLASIHSNEGKIDGRVMVAIIVMGMLLRVLEDGTIYGFFEGGVAGLFVGCIIWHKRIEKRGHIFVPPLPALLLAIGGICLGVKGLVIFAPAFAIAVLLFRVFKSTAPITVPFGLALILSILLFR